MSNQNNLFNFWTASQKALWSQRFPKGAPTTHENCIAVFGVARPGKTKRDQQRRAER
jgi:hypothetical protein